MSKRLLLNLSLLGAGMLLGVAVGPLSVLTTSAQGGCQTFPETGKQVCGRFFEYWKSNGGLTQQGLAIFNGFNLIPGSTLAR